MLHELIKYAECEGLSPEPGFKAKVVRWLLVFSPDGRFLGVHDLRGDDRKSKGREFAKCPNLTQPEMVSAGKGCRHFLVDSLEVICLLTKDGQPDEKQTDKHAYFVNLLAQAKEAAPVLSNISAALSDDATLNDVRASLAEKKAKPMDSATLAVANGDSVSIVVDGNEWHAWWRTFRMGLIGHDGDESNTASDGDSAANGSGRMRCLLSGELVRPTASHNKIERLSDVGGLAMGDSLVSFDKDAFTSFGFEQGDNAAMSETMVSTYVAALNHLLRTRSRKLAGVKIVYWYQGPAGKHLDPSDDPMLEVIDGFGPPPDEEDDRDEAAKQRTQTAQRIRAESKAAQLLDAIRTGERPDLKDYRYFALTLSANSGRVVIRDWMQGRFEHLVEKLDAWSDALELQNIAGSGVVKWPGIGKLATCLLPDLKPGQNQTEWFRAANLWHPVLWKCAIRGTSESLLEAIARRALQQVRGAMLSGEIAEARDAESIRRPLRLSSWYARLALIKMYCLAKGDNEMISYLNEEHPRPAYHCGRLLAACQHAQSLAIGEPKAALLDRFYASASSSPGLIMPRIWKTALHHVKTVRTKNVALGNDLWMLLRSIHARIGDEFPRLLSLYEQGLFQLGFFHQQAFLPTEMTTRRYYTKTRVPVRSKSEVLLANMLTDMGIRYAYEREIEVPDAPGSMIWPDFTIDRGDRPPVIIEHLGLLDQPKYRARQEQKLATFRQLGIDLFEAGGGPNGVLVRTTEADVEDLAALENKIKGIVESAN